MDPMQALDVSSARVVDLVGQVDRSQWELPTPCTEWNVRDLVGHLIGGMLGYIRLLHGAPASELMELLQQHATVGGDDVLAAAQDAATQLRAAFAEPGAQERIVHHMIGDVPGSRLLLMRIMDNVVHGWDLATALGLPAAIDDSLIELVHEYLAPRAAVLSDTGSFAPPPRTLDTGASPQERLLTMVGR